MPPCPRIPREARSHPLQGEARERIEVTVKLRGEVESLRQQLDQAGADHRSEMDRLRSCFDLERQHMEADLKLKEENLVRLRETRETVSARSTRATSCACAFSPVDVPHTATRLLGPGQVGRLRGGPSAGDLPSSRGCKPGARAGRRPAGQAFGRGPGSQARGRDRAWPSGGRPPQGQVKAGPPGCVARRHLRDPGPCANPTPCPARAEEEVVRLRAMLEAETRNHRDETARFQAQFEARVARHEADSRAHLKSIDDLRIQLAEEHALRTRLEKLVPQLEAATRTANEDRASWSWPLPTPFGFWRLLTIAPPIIAGEDAGRTGPAAAATAGCRVEERVPRPRAAKAPQVRAPMGAQDVAVPASWAAAP